LPTRWADSHASAPGIDGVVESELEATLKRAVAPLERQGVPFVLGGGLACWARGGPRSSNDLDLMLKPEDAERALEALAAEGMRVERPPEQWLLKAWDGDVLIDLIFEPAGLPMTDAVLARAERLTVAGVRVPVMALEDVITTKLLALDEHSLDYEPLVAVARSLREQVDWGEVRARTDGSPYAAAFFTLLDRLRGIGRAVSEESGTRVRIA
jgi:predicted nucleotidyltransferase